MYILDYQEKGNKSFFSKTWERHKNKNIKSKMTEVKLNISFRRVILRDN